MKYDPGSYAVFSEQGSSVSHTTATKVISRLLDCDGEVSEAISARTQVKMEHASDLLRLPKLECPTIWIPCENPT